MQSGATAPPLLLLAAAGFLSTAGARIIDPLLAPLAADFHVSIAEMSVIIAAFTMPYGLMQLAIGPLADRFGKLRVMSVLLAAYTLCMAGAAMAGSLAILTTLRACTGAASAGIIPLSIAYIGDAVPYAQRHVAISRFTGGAMLAQTLAGPLGGLFGGTVGWRWVFLLLSLAGLSVTMALASRLRHLPDRRILGRGPNWIGYWQLVANPATRTLLLSCIAEGALFAGTFPFLAPFLHVAFGLPFLSVGLLLACFGLGGITYATVARRIIPRLGQTGAIVLGGSFIAIGMGLAVLVRAWPAFIFIEALMGFGYFALHNVLQTRASEMLPQARSTAVSGFAFMLFLGQSLGALCVGAAIFAWGYRTTFAIEALGAAALTLWLAWLVRRLAARALSST